MMHVALDATNIISLCAIMQVFAQRAFDEYRGEELSPGKNVQTDSELNAFLRAKAETIYHHSGTCRMGSPDNDSTVVVDTKCRVAGVEGLRVVDASIMPSVVSGNTNAPVIMMAEKCSDMILGKSPLPKADVPDWRRITTT
jgi:choline dehydrogenase